MRLTIGRKVLIGNLAMLSLLGGLIAWVIGDFRKLDESATRAADAQQQVVTVNSIAARIEQSRQIAGRVIISMLDAGQGAWSGPAASRQRAELRRSRAPRDSLIAAVAASPFGSRPSIKQSTDNLRVAARELDQVFDEAERLARAGLPREAESMLHRWHEPDSHLQTAIATLRDHAMDDARRLVEDAAGFRERFVRRSTMAGTIAAILMLGMVVLLSISIRRSTRRLSDTLASIATGDFTQRTEIGGSDEFSDLAEGVNAMSERLGELDELKADFLSNVSHELRTPIASVKQSASLLDEEIVGPLNDDQREIVGIVRSNARRLGELINDLLDTAKLEAGRIQLQPEPADLPALVRNVVKTVAPLAQEKSIRITMDAGKNLPQAHIDPLRIEQVVVNLLSNALKFTPEDGAVAIRCSVTSGEMLECAVQDSGIGIPEDELPHVFDKFHQAKAARTSKVKGTGLGLTIVRHIVEGHGGSIRADSTVGEGTTFTFTVPTLDATPRENISTDDESDEDGPGERA